MCANPKDSKSPRIVFRRWHIWRPSPAIARDITVTPPMISVFVLKQHTSEVKAAPPSSHVDCAPGHCWQLSSYVPVCPWVSAAVCDCLSVSLCLLVPVSRCLCVSASLCLTVSLSLRHCVSLPLRLCSSVSPLFGVSVSLCFCVSVPLRFCDPEWCVIIFRPWSIGQGRKIKNTPFSKAHSFQLQTATHLPAWTGVMP